jgi:hypothetical protein
VRSDPMLRKVIIEHRPSRLSMQFSEEEFQRNQAGCYSGFIREVQRMTMSSSSSTYPNTSPNRPNIGEQNLALAALMRTLAPGGFDISMEFVALDRLDELEVVSWKTTEAGQEVVKLKLQPKTGARHWTQERIDRLAERLEAEMFAKLAEKFAPGANGNKMISVMEERDHLQSTVAARDNTIAALQKRLDESGNDNTKLRHEIDALKVAAEVKRTERREARKQMSTSRRLGRARRNTSQGDTQVHEGTGLDEGDEQEAG